MKKLLCLIELCGIILSAYSNPHPKGSIAGVLHGLDAPFRVEVSLTDIANYYAALSSKDTLKINSALETLQPAKTTTMKAYAGALIMKKSGLIKSAKRKLALFNEGRTLLEEAIEIENKNAEFRFLRLIIQENCPAILKYHDKIKEDTKMVKDSYANFSSEVKKAVADYAQYSPSLKSVGINRENNE